MGNNKSVWFLFIYLFVCLFVCLFIFTGVTASHKLAECDLKRMNEYKHLIVEVAQYCEMDPAVICGIISRESRAGATLDNGWGDHGNAFGLMQASAHRRRYHQPVGAWDSKEHIRQATDILVYFINAIKKKFPRWPKEHHFKGPAL
ncbi:lysozyme g [Arapaima gigas]